MRIALDGLLLSRSFSGVEVAIMNLAHALARHGAAHYTFYVPGACPETPPDGERFHTVHTRLPTHFRPLRIAWEQLRLPRLASPAHADLLHAPGYLAPLAARVPVVLTIYDLIALLFPEWCTATNRLNYALMLPRSIRKAAAIIVPSESTRRDLERHFPAAAGKVETIPLGIHDAFRNAPREGEAAVRVRRALKLPERFVLFVGNIEPKKNLPGLLDAYRDMLAGGRTSHRLVLAGAQAWGHSPVRQRIRELGIEEHVTLTGFVPPADLPALYAMADLFVFPSLYEGFGLPVLEAMAAGVPVVTSTAASLPEVAGDAALLVSPADTAGLSAAMERALADDALRSRLVAAGRDRAARYTWQAAARATEACYRRVLGG